MQPDQSRNDREILNFDISRAQGSVDKRNVIPDFAVVRDVTAAHEKTVVPDHGRRTGGGADVSGKTFAEGITVADVEITYGRGIERVILRCLTERCKGENRIVFADRGIAVDVALGDQPRAGADFHMGTDITKRTDFDAVFEYRAVHDNA